VLFDAHLHVIDPRLPSRPGTRYAPEPFTVADYRAATRGLGVVGGAVVAGSFQPPGPAAVLGALAELGPGFAGVVELQADVADEEIRSLHAAGIRAIRVNLKRGGRETLTALDALARRVHDVAGWHTEIYADGTDLAELEPRLRRLPRLAIDHLGMSAAGLPAVLRLAEGGARVKATGFGRVDLDVARTLRAVHEVNPAALMAGTDLPSTRARRPFRPEDLELIVDTLGDAAAPAVLCGNARAFYAP
jgi:predicted TIM-barrel fold metal-dependent hydrolase